MQRVNSLVAIGHGNLSAAYDGVLRVTVLHDPPFVTISGPPENHTFSGYLIELWEAISGPLQLQYKYQKLSNGVAGFGMQLENGTWTGLVGELMDQRTDVGLSWLGFRADRAQVISYLDMVPVRYSTYRFYVQPGRKEDVSLDAAMFVSLLRPLHPHVWLALLGSLFVVALVLMVSVRWNSPAAESEETRLQSGYGSCLLSVFMTVMGQGWATTPDSNAGRIVTLSSWIMGILLLTNYTANLISFVTITTPSPPINSLQELVSSSDWSVAMEEGLGSLSDWARSSDPSERRLYQMVTRRERFTQLDGSMEQLERALQPKTAIYYDISLLFSIAKDKACGLLTIGPADKNTRPSPNYMVIRKELHHLRRQINQLLQKLFQGGSVDRLSRRWFRGGASLCSDTATFSPLTVSELLAVLLIVPLASAVGCVLLAVELLFRRWRRNSAAARVDSAVRHRDLSETWAKPAAGLPPLAGDLGLVYDPER